MRLRTAAAVGQRGLSMIEVLAAMVIFAVSAVTLFTWIGQTADRLLKLKLEQQQLLGNLASLDYLRGMNPMGSPQGRIELGDWVLSWDAKPVGPSETVRNEGGGAGNYAIQLFEVQSTARNRAGVTTKQSLILAGWQKLRESDNALPFAN
ncbi:MAG: type II secretion system protein [Rubrivivax sp.]|nr:MAG: type II secretion system protein [Rubrivivax sp.]